MGRRRHEQTERNRKRLEKRDRERQGKTRTERAPERKREKGMEGETDTGRFSRNNKTSQRETGDKTTECLLFALGCSKS